MPLNASEGALTGVAFFTRTLGAVQQLQQRPLRLTLGAIELVHQGLLSAVRDHWYFRQIYAHESPPSHPPAAAAPPAMVILLVLLLPLAILASSFGGSPGNAALGAPKRRVSRNAVLLAVCCLAAIIGRYTGDALVRLAEAARESTSPPLATPFNEERRQEQGRQQLGGRGEASALPEDIELLELLSPSIDARARGQEADLSCTRLQCVCALMFPLLPMDVRLSNGLEVLAMQDSSSLEGGLVQVSASFIGGSRKEPLHLPGLAFLVAQCTFRGERIGGIFAKEQQQEQQGGYESFAALIKALGSPHPLHLSVNELESSLAFQIPVERLAAALGGLREALSPQSLCSNDLDGALMELKQLQGSLQLKCAADHYCRRNAVLKSHVLNPNHRANCFYAMGLELLHALRSAQWRSGDLEGWRRWQRRKRRLQKDQHRVAGGAPHKGPFWPRSPSPLGGFKAPRLVYVEELGVDVLAADVDIREAAFLWRRHYYVPNGIALVLVGPQDPEQLLLLAHQALGSLEPNLKLQTRFRCSDNRASEIESLNPQPPAFAPQWQPHAADAASADAGTSRAGKQKGRTGADRDFGRPSACPNPLDYEEAGGGPHVFTRATVAASAGAREAEGHLQPVARPKDLEKLLLIQPSSRFSHSVEFIFVMETEGPRRPPCKDIEACLACVARDAAASALLRGLAANLFSMGGPGSCLGALRAAGLAEALEVSMEYTACSAELRVSLSVSGGSLKHPTIELTGKLLFTFIQLWRHLASSKEPWAAVMRRFEAEEIGFHLHKRQVHATAPSLSGLSAEAAYGEAHAAALPLTPLALDGLGRRPQMPHLTPQEEAIYLSGNLLGKAGSRVFLVDWLVQKVPREEFVQFLSALTPSNLILVLESPLIAPLCTRLAPFLRLPFSVLPLEEHWKNRWSALTTLAPDEVSRLARSLGLSLPGEDPFLPMRSGSSSLWHPRNRPEEATAAAGTTDSATTSQEEAANHLVKAVPLPKEGACSSVCEVFIDSRNPIGPLGTAAVSGAFVSVSVDVESSALKIRLQCPSGGMRLLIQLLFSAMWAASSNGREATGVVPLWGPGAPPEFKTYFNCGEATHVQTPFCLGELDILTFSSVKQRTLLRIAAAEGGNWLACIAGEVRNQLMVRNKPPRALVAEVLATITAPDAERAGAILTQEVFFQAFFSAAEWAEAAATSLGLSAENRMPALPSLSDMQPIPLSFLASATRSRNATVSSRGDGKSKPQTPTHADAVVPRVRIRVNADINRAAACSPKGWSLGGSRPHKDYFLNKGGVFELSIQLGLLSSHQLAGAKVMELVLKEALHLHFCERLPACGSVDVQLITEGAFFTSLAVRIHGADGTSQWAGGEALERFLFQLAGAPRVFRSTLATPWHLRRRQQVKREPKRAAAPSSNSNAMTGSLPSRMPSSGRTASLTLKGLLSDESLKRHRDRLLKHLQGADGAKVSLAGLSSCNNRHHGDSSNSGKNSEGVCVRGRTAAEWLGPTRLVYEEEIWRRRYDFSSIHKLLRHAAYATVVCPRPLAETVVLFRIPAPYPPDVSGGSLSPSDTRDFFFLNILAGPWLLVEAVPYLPPTTSASPEFLFYEQAHMHRTSKEPRTDGGRLIESHPIWSLEGSWIYVDPPSATEVALAAAEAANAAPTKAGLASGPKGGLGRESPHLYRHSSKH
ncbi:hypothetical protein cyc_02753 [Cyclospora cayetanensis]|uniref:Peptidase M16 middle/third domain-containing protein n=1 Tax=Cyclospora cayetanensis TaxID=88456 RepID=A0A1D3CU31_9EIME|nr:hypothetical protein cyc_02753 [Cyclospora cayetanensis]